MLNLKIAICEPDQSYANKLASYLISTTYHTISVQVFSNEINLLEFLSDNPIDILLITEKIYLKLKNKINVNDVMILVEHYIISEESNVFYIEKFQQGKRILNQIITYYTSNATKELASKDQETKLIGVYSPLGGCGKTIISIALANTLSLQGKNTLFISLEEIPSYTLLLEGSSESSISDLLYHVRKKTKNLLMKLEGIQKIDYLSGLKYIPPPLYVEDIQELEIEDWEYLISYLLEKKYYDYIVLDFTNELSIRNKLLLEKCNKEIVLTNHKRISKYKIEEYLKKNRKENIMLVYNNNYNDYKTIEKPKAAEEIYSIPYSNNLYTDKGDIISINLNNEFGQAIIKLAKAVNF